MTVLCLFVLSAALFITVLNSKTAKSISIGEKSTKMIFPSDETPGS